jgi:ribosomal-protein-alanine N-acetyltransferase
MNPKTVFTNLPVLETERLYLRPIKTADTPAVFEYAHDPEMTHYTLWSQHRSLEDSMLFVEQILASYAAGRPAPWAVVRKEDMQMIGTTGFVHWFPSHGRAEIGYAIGRKWWAKGYASEAARSALAFGFKKMLCNRIEAVCNVPNTASARVMEKIGMRYEGILRQYLFSQGSYRDVKIYSILRVEWVGK